MSTCEDFELAIERRRRQELDVEEAVRLSTHLGSCASCREFEAFTINTETIMKDYSLAGEVNWDDIGSRVRDMARDYRRTNRSVLASAIPAVAAAPFLAFEYAVPLLLTVAFAIALAMTRSRVREAEEAEAVRGELLKFYRAELDRRIARNARSRFLMPLSGLMFFSVMVGGRPVYVALGTLIAIAFSAWGLYYHLVVRPRLERERAGVA